MTEVYSARQAARRERGQTSVLAAAGWSVSAREPGGQRPTAVVAARSAPELPKHTELTPTQMDSRDRWAGSRSFSTPILAANLVCAVLINSNTLIINYGVKQRQFIKSTSEPRVSDPEESNKPFERTIRGWLL